MKKICKTIILFMEIAIMPAVQVSEIKGVVSNNLIFSIR